jgi:N-acetyl sugar amidotransferase
MYFKKPEKVDKKLFIKDSSVRLFGLPNEIKFCRKCVISNQRPSSTIEFKNNKNISKTTIKIDEDNICDACKVNEIKKNINWKDRELELHDLCNKYRKSDGSYDCLIPGSGGKDSFMQAHLLKYKYKMNPLTVTWAPNIYTDWGWKNHQAWVHAGFDNILFTPNGIVHRLFTRLSMENLFHPFQPFIIGQKNLGPKIAAQYGISLVFYGENESEYGNPKVDFSSAKRSWNYFMNENDDEIFFGGSSLKDLKKIGLKPNNWNVYLPINPEILIDKKIEVHYLGYYEKWHPQSAYYYAIENGGFKSAPERNCGTYQTYQSIDDKMDDFHYHTTFIKFGIGRATYDASQEIRNGDITREEGVALVNRYDGEYPKRWAKEVFEYLSMQGKGFEEIQKSFESPVFDAEYYELLSDKNRSPHLWKLDEENNWKLRNKVKDLDSNINQEISANSWKGNK